jgi:hypothetical protein
LLGKIGVMKLFHKTLQKNIRKFLEISLPDLVIIILKNCHKITSRFLSVDCAAMEHLVVDVDGVTPLERRVSDVTHDAVEVVGSTIVDHLALLGALRHVSEFDNLDLFSQRFILFLNNKLVCLTIEKTFPRPIAINCTLT